MSLHYKDTWGVLMPAEAPLSQKKAIAPEELWDKKLILSQQSIESGFLQGWLKKELNELDVAATYTLAMNAAKMVAGGMGYALILDQLINTSGTALAFRPLTPRLTASIRLVWKKHQRFSKASEVFLQEMEKQFFWEST